MLRNKKLTLGATLGTMFLLMGISVPSCPGQQAMQKQIDDSAAKQAELQKTTSAHSEKVKMLEKEVSDLKTSLGEVAEVLKSHKATIEQVQNQVNEMGSKGGAKKPAPRRR